MIIYKTVCRNPFFNQSILLLGCYKIKFDFNIFENIREFLRNFFLTNSKKKKKTTLGEKKKENAKKKKEKKNLKRKG